jgi:hypothetical protein
MKQASVVAAALIWVGRDVRVVPRHAVSRPRDRSRPTRVGVVTLVASSGTEHNDSTTLK